jgi:hypothetical protein
MFRRLALIAVLVGPALAACGVESRSDAIPPPGGATTPGTDPGTTPPTPPPTSGGDGTPDEGGFGDPVWMPAEFPDAGRQMMTGTVRVLGNGCWMLEVNDQQRLVAFPQGFAGADDDPGTLLGPDGWEVRDGTEIDAVGQITWVESIPGGRDSRYGNLLSFCDPDGVEIAVLTEAEPAFDAAALHADELVALVTGAAFTESWPCGYGFATSTADQHVGLVIRPTADPPTEGEVVLPDAAWRAEIIVGKHLFAQNCDDVLEWWEPDYVAVERWPLVSGRFAVDATSDTTQGCTANLVSTVLTDAVVEGPEGQIGLPPIELGNTAWGCFAG